MCLRGKSPLTAANLMEWSFRFCVYESDLLKIWGCIRVNYARLNDIRHRIGMFACECDCYYRRHHHLLLTKE